MLSRSLIILPLLLGAGCVLAPKAYWVPESVTVERVDYAGWDGLLRDHVRDGRVDYAAISRDPRFDDFVDTLRRGRFTKETTRDEREGPVRIHRSSVGAGPSGENTDHGQNQNH